MEKYRLEIRSLLILAWNVAWGAVGNWGFPLAEPWLTKVIMLVISVSGVILSAISFVVVSSVVAKRGPRWQWHYWISRGLLFLVVIYIVISVSLLLN